MVTSETIQFKRDNICMLSSSERLPYVAQIRVFYPRWRQITAEIRNCHTLNKTAAEPQCVLVTGPTGAGKTTLMDLYARQYPPVVTETGKIMRVLNGTIPAPATVKNLVSALLWSIGDPRAEMGTIGSMTLRLKRYMADCQVELLILDELQHFVDRDSEIVLSTVSDWLKTLIKDTKVACVLVGLAGEAERVVDTNPQLARLFGDPFVLLPFQWDEAQPKTIEEFRAFLNRLDAVLPLREPSHLADYERAWRCFAASQGVISYIMELIRRATYIALTSGREQLDDELLARAFAERLAGTRRGIANPFIGDPPVSAIPLLAPLPPDKRGKSPRRNQKKQEKTLASILSKT